MPSEVRHDSDGLRIALLGVPSVRYGHGAPRRPRGNKVWGLLAYLVLAAEPPARQVLAALLFPDVDDPLGALRWNVSQLRHLLGPGASLAGDPLRLELPEGSFVDVRVLLSGPWTDAVDLAGLDRELLAGVDFDSAPGLELWLVSERVRLAAAAEAILHEATLASMARHRHVDALAHATALVTLNRFDEGNQVLYARALGACGDGAGAREHVEATIRAFRDELGIEPSPAFRAAALSDSATRAPFVSPAAVTAQLEAGAAAIAAGAWPTGIEALRGAAVMAEQLEEPELLVRSHLSVGSALVHAARGYDEEGAAELHRAASLADGHHRPTLAATARRELGYVELLRGRYERARAWLDEAVCSVGDDEAEHAWIAAVRGACESDVAAYVAARAWLETAVERAERSGADAPGAFAHTFLGRLHLLCGALDDADRHLARGIEWARSSGWTSFVPLPLSLLGEVQLRGGDVDRAADTFEHAFAMSCQLGDPCWESLGARGLGLVAAERMDRAAAMALLADAPCRCRRFPDSYLWIEAYALDALCDVAVSTRAPGAATMIRELEAISARTGMRELLARAMVHRVAVGDAGAYEVARSMVGQIDNPALQLTMARVEP